MSSDPEVRRLTLACLLLGFVGPVPPAWLLAALADGLGGVVLFGSNVGAGDRVAELTATLRAAAGREIVVALDEEGGDVTRLDTLRGSRSPGAAALGWLDDPDATRASYAAIAARLVEAGVTLDLAPVADVNSDPRNPVIGVRSFGARPDRVAAHVAAAVRGLQDGGVAAGVKHFPGHGATVDDSHHAVARVDRSRAELETADLAPFRAAVGAGAAAVMTGHLLVPALDPDHLATVSPAITTDLLRGELGFTGTILTDAVEMRAVADTVGMVEGALEALVAGADAVETGARDYPHLVDAIPAAVQAALEDGRLGRDRLQAAAERTAALATRPARPPEPPAGAEEVAARCIEVIGPLPHLVDPLVLELHPPDGMASGPLPWSLAQRLAERVPGTEPWLPDAAPDPDTVRARRAGRSLVLVVRDPHRHPGQAELIATAAGAGDTVIVDVGWPAPIEPGPVPIVRTRGVAPGLLAAAAERLARA